MPRYARAKRLKPTYPEGYEGGPSMSFESGKERAAKRAKKKAKRKKAADTARKERFLATPRGQRKQLEALGYAVEGYKAGRRKPKTSGN